MLMSIGKGGDGAKDEERFVRSLIYGVHRTSWSCQRAVRFRDGDVTQEMNEGEEKPRRQNTCGPPAKIGKDLTIMTFGDAHLHIMELFNHLMPFAPQITPAHSTNLKQRDPEVTCRKRSLPAEFETLQSCLRQLRTYQGLQ
jgi:hypothetical protein